MRKEGYMKTLRKEVQDLINIHERIHTALAQGETLNEDEKEFIHICAEQLIASASYTKHFSKPELRHRESNNGAGLEEGGINQVTAP
jgi:uncharacterized protein YifE (UPF0438 family)